MSNKISGRELETQFRVGHLLAKGLVGEFPVVVAGGSATDTIIGLKAKDFDVFFHEDLLPQFSIPRFFSSLPQGVQSWAELVSEEEVFSSEYGDNTLRARCKVLLYGTEVIVEFISCKMSSENIGYYKNLKKRCGYSVSELQDSFFNDFSRQLLPTFGASSSWSYFMRSPTPTIRSKAFTHGQGCIRFRPVVVPEKDPRMIPKVLLKYADYMLGKAPLYPVKNTSDLYRSTQTLQFMLCEGVVIKTPTFDPEISHVKEGNHGADQKNPLAETEEDLSSLRAADTVGAGSTRPQPFNWFGTRGVTQELQPARGETSWITSTSWDDEAVTIQTRTEPPRPTRPTVRTSSPLDPSF